MIDWRKAIKMRKLFFVFFFSIFIFICLFICLCQVWYSSSLQYTVVVSCGIQFSDQDQTQGPLHCRPGVLTHWTTREVPKWRDFFGDFGDSVHEEGFPGGDSGKECTCQCRRPKNPRFNPGPGKSPGGGHGNPLRYSCLENPMDSGALAVYSPLACKESDVTEVT